LYHAYCSCGLVPNIIMCLLVVPPTNGGGGGNSTPFLVSCHEVVTLKMHPNICHIFAETVLSVENYGSIEKYFHFTLQYKASCSILRTEFIILYDVGGRLVMCLMCPSYPGHKASEFTETY